LTAPQGRVPSQEYLTGFLLFLLLNAALFVRPADVIPDLRGVEIYQYLILACLAVSFPAVLERLSLANLEKSPIDVFVIAMFPFMFLGHLVNFSGEEAWECGFDYFKILLYYFLLISLVTTSQRLKIFIGCLIVYTTAMTVVSLLDFYEYLALPREMGKYGEPVVTDTKRMYGPGIFNDPNDVCVVINTALIFLLGLLMNKQTPKRFLWILLLPVLLYGFAMTQSRGGLLSLVAGLIVVGRLKWGWGRVILLGAVFLPIAVAVIGGRQTDISSDTDTGQGRIHLWFEGFIMIRMQPIFGVGVGNYASEAGQVAHNSYMQAFAENGLFGGTIFLGLTLLAIGGIYQFTKPRIVGLQLQSPVIEDPDYRYYHPYLAGAMMAYSVGMMGLTLNTLLTTYTFLGLVSVFLSRATTNPPVNVQKLEIALFVRYGLISVGFLAFMFVFVRLAIRY
jgi:O-antigen ligase